MSQAAFGHGDLQLTAGEDAVEELRSAVEGVVRALRAGIDSDRRLEAILRDESRSTPLERRDTVGREVPERFTEERVIDALLAALGFDDRSQRPADVAEECGAGADYAVRVASEHVLIGTAPLNETLDRPGAGVARVKGWLENRRVDAEYGIATNGLRWILLAYDEASYRFDTLADVDLRAVFLRQFDALTGRANGRGPVATDDATTDRLGRLIRYFERDNLRTIVSRASDVIGERRAAITEEFYEEYIRLVFGIVDEETGETTDRCLVGDGVEVPDRVERDFENPRRLFAVSLVNRLVFIKFLEDAGLVEDDLLLRLRADYEGSTRRDGFYSACIHPLFYRVFDRKRDDREGRAAGYFDGVPPLNGGLFRPVLSHQVDHGERGDALDRLVRLERRFRVSDAVLADVIDLLGRYRFTTDDGIEMLADREVDPLGPSVLGNVFEKTINYLAGETGRQKDLGAFYTPDEITHFTAAETIRPVALETLQARLRARGWGEAELDRFDDVDELLSALPRSTDLEADLQAALDSVTVCDPACGSGHFLTAVLGELMTIRKRLARRLQGDVLDRRTAVDLKERTIRRNVFGVDIVAPAIEIATFRLWLSVVGDLDPDAAGGPNGGEIALPTVSFNLRVGNSLVGVPGLDGRCGGEATPGESDLLDAISDCGSRIEAARRTRGGIEPALAAIAERRDAMTESVDAAFTRLVADEPFEDTLALESNAERAVVEAVTELADAASDASVATVGFYVDGDHPLTEAPTAYADDTLDDLGFTAHTWKAKRSISGSFSPDDAAALVDAVSSHPDDGVADVYVERTVTSDDLDALSRFHWPVEFPDAVSAGGGDESASFGFDVVVGNPPFGAEVDGLEAVLTDREECFACHGANNSAEHFLERAIQLTRPGGRIGFVLPKTLSYYASWRELRSTLLAESPPVALFDNGLAFDGVDYEQVTLVAAPADGRVADRDVDTYVAEALRDETANAPVHAGSVPLDAMRSRGVFLLRPMTERDREIAAALEADKRPLGDLWDGAPRRGVYVPDSRKASLADGETPFVERVPSVQRYYLEADGVWHVDLGDLPAGRRSRARATMTPRLLFKVLRGSRLSVYPDATGRFASTEKLVNVPIRGDATHTLRSLTAVLNSPVVSYYLQKLLFSETTETARVMDAHYIEDVPIPTVTDRRAACLDAVVETLLFAAQVADDGHGGERAGERVALLGRVADALVADCYFELGADELWDAVDRALVPLAFDGWADARFSTGAYPIDGTRTRWDAVETGVGELLDADVERTVAAIESDDRLRRIEDVLGG